MDSLPNEVLDTIVGYTDVSTYAQCRLLNRRWNLVATRHLRQSCVISFASKVQLKDFLRLADKRTQDFPFCRFRTEKLHKMHIDFWQILTDSYGSNIRSLDTGPTDDVPHAVTDEALKELFVTMGTLQNLRHLTTNLIPVYFKKGMLPNIKKLTLACPNGTCRLPIEYIQTAPNLQEIVVSKFEISCSTCQVDIPEEYKVIALIRFDIVCMRVRDVCSSTNEKFIERLENFVNIRIGKLEIFGARHGPPPQSTFFVDRILQLQANHLEGLSIDEYTSYYICFKLPKMQKLCSLEISCISDSFPPLANIENNTLSNLETVEILDYKEPLTMFNYSDFEKVRSLTLRESGKMPPSRKKSGCWTNFATAFPNLAEFAYFNGLRLYELNFDIMEHILTTLTMDTLRTVQFSIVKKEEVTSQEDMGIARNRRLIKVFSGFDDLKKVARDGRITAKRGIIENTAYWERMEKLRRHTFVGMKGLTSLKIDFPISDDFVEGVLLRIPPLPSLTVVLHKVSNTVRQKLETHHSNKFCSENFAINPNPIPKRCYFY